MNEEQVVATGDASNDGLYEYIGTISEVSFANVDDKKEFARVATDHAKRMIGKELTKKLKMMKVVVNEEIGTFSVSLKDTSHMNWTWDGKGVELIK